MYIYTSTLVCIQAQSVDTWSTCTLYMYVNPQELQELNVHSPDLYTHYMYMCHDSPLSHALEHVHVCNSSMYYVCIHYTNTCTCTCTIIGTCMVSNWPSDLNTKKKFPTLTYMYIYIIIIILICTYTHIPHYITRTIIIILEHVQHKHYLDWTWSYLSW